MPRHPQALARVRASESQLATKQRAAQGLADQWLRRAELALQKGGRRGAGYRCPLQRQKWRGC
jgi:phage shock protein A